MPFRAPILISISWIFRVETKGLIQICRSDGCCRFAPCAATLLIIVLLELGAMQRWAHDSTAQSLVSIVVHSNTTAHAFAHERSSGTFTSSAQHMGQQVPESSGLTYLKGGLQSIAAQLMPEQVSEAPLPGEYTG